MLTNRYLLLGLMALGVILPASAQTTIFNCPSFTSSTGSCSVATGRSSSFTLNGNGPPSVSGSQVLLMPTGAQHQADSVIWNSSAVNVQTFSTTFTFIPNGWNLAFVIQNNTNIYAGPEGPAFSAGAGCEGGFWQAFDSATPPYPSNIFALNLDSTNMLTATSSSFAHSSAQIYTTGQNPCIPNDGAPNYTAVRKISTAPVSLNSPASSANTSTGDTYSATITYDGTNVVLSMHDITVGGSCPGPSCFAYTWTDVNIPSMVNGNTAWVGLTSATNQASSHPLYIKSFSYSEGATTRAAIPTLSPAAGTYSGAQSVSISDATPGATIYYTMNGTTPTASSIQYTGPITVSSTETLEAVAVATEAPNSAVASAAYTITSIGVGSPMSCLPLQSVPGEPGTLQTVCTVTLAQ
jgi:Chitobiase/beta-hexosaminidase C-terminal domain